MDFFAHAITEHRINHLVPGDQALALKGLADNARLEVMAIASDLQKLAVKTRLDVCTQCFG